LDIQYGRERGQYWVQGEQSDSLKTDRGALKIQENNGGRAWMMAEGVKPNPNTGFKKNGGTLSDREEQT